MTAGWRNTTQWFMQAPQRMQRSISFMLSRGMRYCAVVDQHDVEFFRPVAIARL